MSFVCASQQAADTELLQFALFDRQAGFHLQTSGPFRSIACNAVDLGYKRNIFHIKGIWLRGLTCELTSACCACVPVEEWETKY